MKIHYLQHVSFEGLGYIERWLEENKHAISTTSFFEDGYTLPSLGDIDALIILGGPMSVHDEIQFPWLAEEKAFITACILAGKRVLGICLGAQLMASCLGAGVGRAGNKEIGWFPVQPTEACKDVAWFYDLFRKRPNVFHWHGEQFDIPQGCLDVLSSEANGNQAFYLNKNVMGFQFHLEATPETTELMLENGREELTEDDYIQTGEQIKKGIVEVENGNGIMQAILYNWIS